MTRTRIEWATDTWNPVTGCTKVSEGCRNCYAERQVQRFGTRVHGLHRLPEFKADVDRICTPPKFGHVICHPEKLDQPLRWRNPRRVFVCSMSDLFHEDVPFSFVAAVMGIAAASQDHQFILLTKRAHRMAEFFAWLKDGAESACDANHYPACDWLFAILSGLRVAAMKHVRVAFDMGTAWPLPNVIGMVSIEDQRTAADRVSLLLQAPFAIRGVSYEPALAPVDLTRWLRPRSEPHKDGYGGDHAPGFTSDMRVLDWVICGGESGPGARPMHPDWARSLRDQCQAASVPFFFKQWGEWAPFYDRDRDDPDWLNVPAESDRTTRLNVAGGSGFHGERVVNFRRIGKKAAGHELDGEVLQQYPGEAR